MKYFIKQRHLAVFAFRLIRVRQRSTKFLPFFRVFSEYLPSIRIVLVSAYYLHMHLHLCTVVRCGGVTASWRTIIVDRLGGESAKLRRQTNTDLQNKGAAPPAIRCVRLRGFKKKQRRRQPTIIFHFFILLCFLKFSFIVSCRC